MEAGLSNLCKPRFRILDDAQIGRIHQAVLKILGEVGVRVNHLEALDLLAGHGARVMDDNLVLDVIKQVGPGGNFLQEKHTLDFFMKEHWQPGVFNRKNLPNWIKDGQKKTDDKLLEKAREILDTHQPEPLAADIKNQLDRIWEDTKSRK